MIIKDFNDFVEFQNTEAVKEYNLREKPLTMRFNLNKSTNTVTCTISKPLYNCMMRHDLERFKFFINEKNAEILIRLDKSTKCIDIEKKKLRPVGVTHTDKFISITFRKIFANRGVTSLNYVCEYSKEANFIYCKPIAKTKKGE